MTGLGALVGMMSLDHAKEFALAIKEKSENHKTEGEKCNTCDHKGACITDAKVMAETAAIVVESITSLKQAIDNFEGVEYERDSTKGEE